MKRIAVGFAIFFTALALYLSNGQTMGSFDSAPTSELAFNLLERHQLDLDPFRNSYFVALGGQYGFMEAPSGHLTSLFPVGTAILSFPLYAVLYTGDRLRGGTPAIRSPAFEPHRRQDEKVVAACLGAVAVVLFARCATMLGGVLRAAIGTAVFALGTSMWTIGSQALWQHGPVNLCVLAMIIAFLRATRASEARAVRTWLIVAGVIAGFLPVVRPTSVLFSIAGLAFAGLTFRSRAWPAAAGAIAGFAPGLAWNAYFFHSLVGGYSVNLGSFRSAPQSVLTNLVGLLISPSKGVLIYCPVLLFGVSGIVRAARLRDPADRLLLLLALASAALIGTYACYAQWWGGYAYGPRFLTDIAGIGALLVLFGLPGRGSFSSRPSAPAQLGAGLFAAAFGWSVLVQFAGANSGAAGADWNAVPISVERAPDRLWQLRDSQIQRNVLATYQKFFNWKLTQSAQYRADLAAHVVAISALPLEVRRRTAIALTAIVSNDGRSRAYGYASGTYAGQMRVAVTIRTDRGDALAEQDLYLAGSPQPGQRAPAIGTVVMPAIPGIYTLQLRPIAIGLGPVKAFRALTVALKIT